MSNIRIIAIYLPQFHPIPENDKAWGAGFTEWTNVKNAQPVFEGHYQPHVPHEDIGYYDLLNPEVMDKQARLARDYGIHGFALYHYWFNGKRLLETPLDNMLSSGKPDFPFCYIWANENWSKRWDGSDHEIIIRHVYNHEDDLTHISFLCENVFCDPRYIRIDNKPLFLVYRTELFPDIKATAGIWRQTAQKNGFPGLYLVRIDNITKNINPSKIGFDAVMEFGPDWSSFNDKKTVNNYNLIDYEGAVENMIAKKHEFKTFNCIFPGWDNSPRRKKLGGTVFINNTPELFRLFMNTQIINTLQRNINEEEQILFINAWNEWGEGCHIEPDEKNGYAWLEVCREVLTRPHNTYDLLLHTNYIKHLKNESLLKEVYNISVKFVILKTIRFLKRLFSFIKVG